MIVTEPASRELLDRIDHGASQVFDTDTRTYAALLDAHRGASPEPSAEALDPHRLLLLLFTSGSTGAPKAVKCTTGRWAFISQLTPIEFTPADVAYNAMPLFHGNALMGSLGPVLVNGAAFAMRRKFSASGFLPDIQKFGATFFNYVGRSLAYILAQPERDDEADNSLRFGFGTEASARDRSEFLRRYQSPLFESYGSSEGACYIIHTPETPEGALGVAQQGHDVEIGNPDGTTCAPARFDQHGALLNPEEATGEIVSRDAAAKFDGYYNNPEAEAEKLRGGDFWTGDLGYRDERGFFWFAGRTADWLRVDSENFAAAPVERILGRFPGVIAAAVYPMPDPVTGDQVVATLETVDGAFDPADFTRFLSGQPDLGTKWAPRLVHITEEMPVTVTNKISKPDLQQHVRTTTEPVYQWDGHHYVLIPAGAR